MKVFLARALLAAIPCVAAAQVAVLQIKIVEGEGAVHPPGARVARPITVEVTDDGNRPVTGAAVSFQLPPDGPGGLFSNGLRTDLVLTDAAGRATIHSMQLNKSAGQFRIRITAVKEQARAGLVSVQYIGGKEAATAAAVTREAPAAAPNESKARVTENSPAAQPAARAGEITPTTAKMSAGGHKKWIVAAIIVAGAGVALVGVSRSRSAQGSTESASTVSIGAPTVTVGAP